ncbi:MAG: molybdopterin-dependent oxidoreductase [Deltaproteobacteria bacterium]|nr:molybdopterin-dependent oxidoreductase [Deltaproteobacteria bacterium]
MSRRTELATCSLCEAACGISVQLDEDRILRIRGDEEDPLSRGYVCPKALALADLHVDPDRLRHPIRRCGDRWEPIGWDEALDLAATRLAQIRRANGPDAVAVYLGNPTIHSFGAALFSLLLVQGLRTKNFFSSNSVDGLPRLLTSFLVYGSQAVMPIPDIDRTSFLLIVGANPVVSNGSVMSAPGAARRLEEIKARGGRIVVVDPRRTETAELAGEHVFIRPGTDAFLLLGLLHTIFEEGLESPGRLEAMCDGLDRVRAIARGFAPERLAPVLGIEAVEIRALARDFARAPSAVCYGRMGTCTQEFGTLSSWLIDVLNTVTGNLDRIGGAMFTTPAVDLVALADRLGQRGHFARWRSRVRGLPEFNGELPVAAFAGEMETPGDGQIRALVTHAGNPVLSLPNGRRLERALSGLEFMVSIDIYLNETTRHADLILPPTFGLEHDHYPLVFHSLSVRNVARYSRAVFPRAPAARHDWEILLDLTRGVLSRGRLSERLASLGLGALHLVGPRGILRLLLRLGPHSITFDRLRAEPHGIDLGPLEPRMPGLLAGRRIQLAPGPLVADVERLERSLAAERAGARPLTLISRRLLSSNNSWMHNSPKLVRGRDRCTLLVNPADAARRGIRPGDRVRIVSRAGAIEAPVVISDEVAPGVVCLPHGFGHARDGTRLAVASRQPGVSINDVVDDGPVDGLSGCSSFVGTTVEIERVAADNEQAAEPT